MATQNYTEEQVKMLVEQSAAGAPAAPLPTPQPSTDHVTPADFTASTITIQARLSNFWTTQPRLWFHQFEAVMAPQKAGDLCKYQLVIAKLGRDELSQIGDILENPPDTGKYDALKNRLINAYEESETIQLQKLLTEIELGDQKPSQLLRKMKELGRNKVQEDTIKLLWLKRLPNTVRAVIAACNNVKLDEIAQIADKIIETSRTASDVYHIDRPATSVNEQLAAITQELAAMNRRFEPLLSQRGRPQQRNTQPRRPRSQSRARARENQEKYREQKAKPGDSNFRCFYHYIYGDEAIKCGDNQCSKALN